MVRWGIGLGLVTSATGGVHLASQREGGHREVLQVSVGVGSACAIVEGGRVRCWGRSDDGEIGHGRAETQAATPVEVPGIAGANSVFVFDRAACSIVREHVWCWGDPDELPAGARADGRPSEISALAGATQLSFHDGVGLARMSDGTMRQWGSFGSTPPSLADVREVLACADRSCAILDDGTVACWMPGSRGHDPVRVRGISSTIAIAEGGQGQPCALSTTGRVVCWSRAKAARSVEKLDNVVGITGTYSVCALRADGTVWCWDRRHPTPAPVPGLIDAVHVSAAGRSMCATRRAGDVVCWGNNHFGQLGDGTLIDHLVPAPVRALTWPTLPVPTDGADHVPEAAVAQSWEGMPADCEHDERHRSAYAIDSGRRVDIMLADYRMERADWFGSTRGRQRKTEFELVAPEGQSVRPGTYNGHYGFKGSWMSDVWWNRIDRVGFHDLHLGEVEVTYRDRDWICGKNENVGSFAARFIPDPYRSR